MLERLPLIGRLFRPTVQMKEIEFPEDRWMSVGYVANEGIVYDVRTNLATGEVGLDTVGSINNLRSVDTEGASNVSMSGGVLHE